MTADDQLWRLLNEYHAAHATFAALVPTVPEPLVAGDAPPVFVDETAAAEAANRLARAAEQLRAYWEMRAQ